MSWASNLAWAASQRIYVNKLWPGLGWRTWGLATRTSYSQEQSLAPGTFSPSHPPEGTESGAEQHASDLISIRLLIPPEPQRWGWEWKSCWRS